ncbi:putative dynamin GTPase [Rosa chinensis]|uniref:Putative dynamin GTPase n=1 Tax=Rosa chinensis TaxID=74649 RepID=A0A2P6QSK4_ROSCH|nr:putative dynamin GTPase [Rosa chinensis]
MERQCKEEEVKTQSSRKGQEAEQSVMNRASSPQTGGQQSGGTLKSLKDKFSKEEKEVPEASGLKTLKSRIILLFC